MDKKILSLLLVAVSAAAGIYFRLYPLMLPGLDMAATQETYDNEREVIKKTVLEKFPDLPFSAQTKFIDQVFKQELDSGDAKIKARVDQRRQELKNRYRDEEGRVYLNGIDSYYWLRLLKNLLEKGHIGDRQVNGVEYDDLIGGPIDSAMKKNVHLWLGVAFYKTASFFVKDIPLEGVLFYIPLFLSCVIAIFTFYVAKRLGANDLGAFFASITVNLSNFFMIRSIGEWFDTDIYNILFPLLTFGTFLYAFENRKLARRIFFCALSGLFLACYASTWQGWWFIFDIMLVSGFLFILNQKLSQEETKKTDSFIKDQLSSVVFFFLFSSFFCIVLNGFSVWKDFISEPLRLSTILKVVTPSLWPNVYLTVAELEPVKPFELVNVLGGQFVFFGCMLGLIYIFLAEKGIRDTRYGFGLLCLVLWICSTFYVAVGALRFGLLLVVPIGLAFGLTISKIYDIVDRTSRRYLQKVWIPVSRSGIVLIFSIYLVSTVAILHAKLLPLVPQINDEWYRALTKIKNETPKDAIVDSWWDFGHCFKAIAQRRVLFDGMTQNTPYAYWVARVLLTDNEEEALGILKMINTSDNQAADLLEKKEGMTAALAVDIIKKACAMKEDAARAYLKTVLSQETVEPLLAYLFPKTLPPVYLIVSYDMLGKIGPISYIGNWDFKKADMWIRKNHLSQDNFLSYCIQKVGLTREEAEKKLSELSLMDSKTVKMWFSNVWGYFSVLSPSRQDGPLLFFENGLVVDLDNHHAAVQSEYSDKRGVPQSLIYDEAGKMKEEPQKDATLKFDALMIKEGDVTKSLLLTPSLAKSLMVRLYFLKGEGVKAFKLFDKEEDDNGNAIYVYQVVWPGQK